MHLWQTDEELFALAEKELFTCVVGDVLDQQDLLHQYLPPEICPLSPMMTMIGRAMPVLAGHRIEHLLAESTRSLACRDGPHPRRYCGRLIELGKTTIQFRGKLRSGFAVIPSGALCMIGA